MQFLSSQGRAAKSGKRDEDLIQREVCHGKITDVPEGETPGGAWDGVESFHGAKGCCGFGVAALRREDGIITYVA